MLKDEVCQHLSKTDELHAEQRHNQPCQAALFELELRIKYRNLFSMISILDTFGKVMQKSRGTGEEKWIRFYDRVPYCSD